MKECIWLVGIGGVIVAAISGALAAGRKRMDLFGVVVLAGVTALGGGTVRDMILGVPIFWVPQSEYIYVVVVTAILTFIAVRRWRLPENLLMLADAFGLAFFTLLGAQKALACGVSGTIAIIMGVVTGVVGGMLRDVLVSEIPFICRGELYATASLCGAIAYVGLMRSALGSPSALAASFLITLGLRLAAMRWRLVLPYWRARHDG